MASSHRNQSSEWLLPPEKAVELLERQMALGEALARRRSFTDADHQEWTTQTKECLNKTYGSRAPEVAAFASEGMSFYSSDEIDREWLDKERVRLLRNQLMQLRALVQGLVNLCDMEGTAPAIMPTPTRQILLVHGHDEPLLRQTQSFLQGLGQVVVVLRDNVDGGLGVIETFEASASTVGFAMVLLPADERSRQNSLFELGYLGAKLGRHRVCAVYQRGTELASKAPGVAYLEFDGGGEWRPKLAEALKNAGLPVEVRSVQ